MEPSLRYSCSSRERLRLGLALAARFQRHLLVEDLLDFGEGIRGQHLLQGLVERFLDREVRRNLTMEGLM